MNEILQSKLNLLAQDELMIEAIKTLIAERIEKEKPIIERTDDDKLLGEKYRAYEQAKNMLDEVLLDLEAYNNQKNKINSFNKER